MSNLSTITQDLLNKLKTVPALGENVGCTLGGTEADPTLASIPAPFAWVIFHSSTNEDTDRPRYQRIRANYVVFLGIDYGKGESDFVDNQLTLIDDVTRAVGGTEVSVPGPGRWSYEGSNWVHTDPNRAVYALNFSAVAHYQPLT